MNHKFAIGQEVIFLAGIDAQHNLNVTVRGRITRLMPRDGADNQYHVQADLDGTVRRARESQLRSLVI
jgi:hypothetical protein